MFVHEFVHVVRRKRSLEHADHGCSGKQIHRIGSPR